MDIATKSYAESLTLAEFMPYRLAVLSNTISRQLAQIYEGEYGLSVRQWQVMAILGECDGLSAKEVVTRTALDKVAVSRAVSALIELSYLTRKATKEDGRLSVLHLTRSGRGAYDAIAPQVKAREAELMASLSGSQRKALTSALEVLADAASPDAPLW